MTNYVDCFSPSKCAENATKEILELSGHNPEEVHRLVREVIRNVYEHCAQISEDWVARHDQHDHLSGEQVGDHIADELRRIHDERKRKRTLA